MPAQTNARESRLTVARAALKPAEKPADAKRAKPSAARAKPSVQRKPKTEKDEQEDRKSALLGGGVQAKLVAQRMAAEEEPAVQAKGFIQRKADDEEPTVQAKPLVQRQAANEEAPTVQAKLMVQRMTLEEAQIDETKKLNDTGTGVKIQKAGFVSSPEDASEREADRVADNVVNSNNAEVQRVTAGVQRK
ncbi:MAG: hypothetical protein AAGK02_14810, partial [Pseudomonadota bacterium]